jgi:phosphatidylglycerol---prolipoprotein diacylglyceryl transferase
MLSLLTRFVIAPTELLAQFASPGPTLVQLGPLTIRWYGLLIASAVLIGVSLSQYLAKRRQINPELIGELAIWLVIAAIPCARLYYVAFQWQDYAHNPGQIFAIWQGGIAIHGAILGGIIAALMFAKRNRIGFWQLADVVVPSLILGQAIGRWGNFFNSEAFGAPTDLPWKLFIPAVSRPQGYADVAYYHPTFLYESLWNLMIFAVLITLFFKGLNRKRPLRIGTISLAYLVGYGSGRIWIEGLRMDSLMLGPLRIAQVVSLAEVAIGLVGLIWLYRYNRPLPDIVSSSRSQPNSESLESTESLD